MDKSSYETYEYPPANESESEPDQFFIVQDNGTFLIDTNRQVQYVAQVQNVKDTMEPSQPCTVFDVAPQQYLVDVDNASELISVSDQYVTDAQSNLFSNSYLLPTGTATTPEPMEQNVADSLDEVSEISKPSGDCTEITLSDEQYQMLEQKGWLLLEIGNKMYVLNTLGLHDITANDKLIEKLKNESQSNESHDMNIGTCILGYNAGNIFQSNQKDIDQTLSGQVAESGNVNIRNDFTVAHNSVNSNSILIDSKANVVNDEKPITFNETKVTPEVQKQDTEMNTRVLVIENENIRREGNMLKVKTKLSLKDFPERIILGKTLKGKRLVAKVVRQNKNADLKTLDCNKDKPEDHAVLMSLSSPYNHTDSNTAESEFHILLQHLFRNNVNKTKCTADDVVTADSVIAQLLQIPAFKPSVIDNNLIITKVFQKTDSFGKILNKELSAVVTGKVSEIAEQWRFIHLPHMLQKMVNNTEKLVSKFKKSGSAYTYIVKDDYSVLHVQISESKEVVTGVVRISVTVNKRNIPVQLITNRHQHQPNKKYACSACAAVFGTELELRDHQADHSLEAEDMLTIDIDQSSKTSNLCVIETDKGKIYTCMQCNATFNRLTTCKNHLKTHYNTLSQEKTESAQDENNTKTIYKCNMCTCTYFHPSTLSKHILSRHINKVPLLADNYFLQ